MTLLTPPPRPEWGTRECMGNYTAEEQQPDKDLGRSLKPGWRNIAREVRCSRPSGARARAKGGPEP